MRSRGAEYDLASPLMGEISRTDIAAAATRIGPYIRRTPILDLGAALSPDYRLFLKLDSMQPTGSFKVRGAFSALTAIAVPEAGVVAASGGNFGLAVAHASAALGVTATIFVPDSSPPEKVGGLGAQGAEVIVVPGHYAEALAASREWAGGFGAVELHAYDQPAVVAGQGTCAREIMEQVPSATSILTAVGGGGLIGGIASWARHDLMVIGVEPELCPTLHEARRAGEPVDVEVGGVAVSSLGTTRVGRIGWEANHWIDDAVLVGDEAIIEAQTWLWDTCRVLAEPAACAPLAALATGAHRPEPGEIVVAVVSGANTRRPDLTPQPAP
jgi:threonine dehydratase